MRIWVVPYHELDGKRVLGQHNEVHMLRGYLTKKPGRSWPDPFNEGERLTVADLPYLAFVHALTTREMKLRGWTGHRSAFDWDPEVIDSTRFNARIARHHNQRHAQRERDRRDLVTRWGGAGYRGRGDVPEWYERLVAQLL